MNTSILVSCFKYLNVTKLTVSLAFWIYGELVKVLFNKYKFTNAIKTYDFEVIRSLIDLATDNCINESVLDNFNWINRNVSSQIKPLVDANMPRLNEVLLVSSCYFNFFDFVKTLIENGTDVRCDGNASLNFACTKGNSPELVMLLLESGADVHDDYEYPLRIASWYDNDKIVEILLKYGADPRAIIDKHDVQNNNIDAYKNSRKIFEDESKQ